MFGSWVEGGKGRELNLLHEVKREGKFLSIQSEAEKK